MNWVQCIILGLISGLSEFIPASVTAHQRIVTLLFGVNESDPVRGLIIHIFSLAALIIAWRGPIDVLRREDRMAARGTKVYNRIYRGNMDFRFLKTAAVPLLIGMVVLLYFGFNDISFISTAAVLIINGFILFLTERLLQGNKDARLMSGLDAIMVGAGSALSVIPGFSRIGICTSICIMRGADRKHALNWAYILSIPALLLQILSNLAYMIFGGNSLVLSTGVFGYFLVAIGAFVGAYISIIFMKHLITNRGIPVMAYLSWGAALFVFVLYLI